MPVVLFAFASPAGLARLLVARWAGSPGAVPARGAKVTAHVTRLSGARVCAEAGVDPIERGFELDADAAQLMAERGVALVTAMTVMKSWLTFMGSRMPGRGRA